MLESGHTETVLPGERVDIVWNPSNKGFIYADKMYQGIAPSGKPYNYSKDKNPNAQSHWFEVAKNEKQGWKQLIQKLFG